MIVYKKHINKNNNNFKKNMMKYKPKLNILLIYLLNNFLKD